MRALRTIVVVCLAFVVLAGAFFITLVRSDAHVDSLLADRHAAVRAFLGLPLLRTAELTFLTTPEQSHMADVKRILDVAKVVHLVALGTLIGIGFAVWRMPFSRPLAREAAWYAGLALVGVVVLMGAFALVSFDAFFSSMHAVLFPHGNWRFPEGSALLEIYPETFFRWFGAQWAFATASAGGALAGAGWLGMRRARNTLRGNGRREDRGRVVSHRRTR